MTRDLPYVNRQTIPSEDNKKFTGLKAGMNLGIKKKGGGTMSSEF